MPDDRPAAEDALLKAGAVHEGSLTVGGSAWRLADGQRLDLLAMDESWTEIAVHSPVRGPDGLPYISLPYLVVMKLAAGRLQDLADISRMLGAADQAALDDVFRVVRRHRPDDLEDLASMIHLGKLEYR